MFSEILERLSALEKQTSERISLLENENASLKEQLVQLKDASTKNLSLTSGPVIIGFLYEQPWFSRPRPLVVPNTKVCDSVIYGFADNLRSSQTVVIFVDQLSLLTNITKIDLSRINCSNHLFRFGESHLCIDTLLPISVECNQKQELYVLLSKYNIELWVGGKPFINK